MENHEEWESQATKDSGAVYSLIIHNKTPRIRPGGKVEIEVFISGHGMPEMNKLYVQLSSPYVISKEDAGVLTTCIKCATDIHTGKMQPVTGKAGLETWKLNPNGITVLLNKCNFLSMPSNKVEQPPGFGIRSVLSEIVWDENPPILLSVNTANDARSGDYDVAFAFTYGNEKNLLQDYKVTQFHITSCWERIQPWVVSIGAVIAFVSLLITAIGTICEIIR